MWLAGIPLYKVVALSTMEPDFIALSEAIKEAIWLVEEPGFHQIEVTVMCDNQSTIPLSHNQQYHERSKHIDVKLHFVRE